LHKLQKKHGLRPRDIDAHWVKRYLSKHFDPNESQQKAQDVLNILKVLIRLITLPFYVKINTELGRRPVL
jgi:hypothetical protein